MSGRHTNGLSVPIIFLLLGNLCLAGFCYSLWHGRERAEAQARQAVAERERARQEADAATRRLDRIKPRVSREPAVDFDQLVGAMDDDIRQFGTGIPNESYADVVRHLHGTIESLRAELRQIAADKDRLQHDYVALERIKQAEVAQATTATQEARQELATEQTDYQRKIAAKDQEIHAILDRASTTAAKLATEQRDKQRIREELLSEVNKLRTILEEARAPFTPAALAKQTPDGKIIRASAATKTAWISIGSKHGVQPQLTFSVQPAGFSGNPSAKPKATLEVVRVEGPELSEARILGARLADPVIEGDLIFNPAWNPGRPMRFALAGMLDINADGEDDREKVRQMIKIAGAKVDAEILPDGTERGEVTVETNYFIRGQRPDPERAGPIEMKVLSSMARMERTALDYGAIVINIDKFLDLLGYAPNRRLQSSSAPRLTPGAAPNGR